MSHDYLAAYREAFSHPEYSKSSPSEDFVKSIEFETLVRQYHLTPDRTHFVEFGAGCGRAIKHLLNQGYTAVGVDIDNFMEDPGTPFVQCDITDELAMCLTSMMFRFDYSDEDDEPERIVNVGLCIDVMEHIALDDARTTIKAMLEGVEALYLQIACFDDAMTNQLGLAHKMHINVQDGVWWGDLINEVADELGMVVRWAVSKHEGYFKCLVTE